MRRSSRSCVGQIRRLVVTLASTLGIAYMIFLLYLMTSASYQTGTVTAAGSKEDHPFGVLLEESEAGPPALNPDLDTPEWCLFPQKSLGRFLKSLFCV